MKNPPAVWTETDLRLADEHIARAKEIIARQEAIIGELLRDNHDASQAEQLLESFRRSLDVFLDHKRFIEQRLSRDRQSGAP